ncbi:MAG: succinate dehydrogenase [Phycisphaerales bacterium]|nr:succinate dehydrogenase [Phycisphaerales bacterium]
MSGADLHLPQMRRLGETKRKDAWWIQPTLVFLGFSAFIVYSTWAALQGAHFYFGGAAGANYLSPFYSPLLFEVPGRAVTGHSWFGAAPDWLLRMWPSFIPFSPALLILWAPGGFRFTCYYYRGAYYKAFWADPISCAVGEPGFRGEKYRGERRFPLIIQNIHRYFLYLAVGFIGLLAWDAVQAFRFTGADGSRHLGVGVGTLVLCINPVLLGAYTFGCHSLRHLIGGRKDCISDCSAARAGAYRGVTCLNRRHMLFAWLSLFWVGFTDFYVRMCSTGYITDLRLI